MARIFPDMDKVKQLRQPATPGELFLLEYLQSEFDEDADVYFQSYLNGDRPDIVIIKEGVGVIVVEVKDWILSKYQIDSNNKWRIKLNNVPKKSPMAQAFSYKRNLFDLHVNGLLEKNLRDMRFFGLINCYVYFHGASKPDLEALYSPSRQDIRDAIHHNEQQFKDKNVSFEQYETLDLHLKKKLNKLDRDQHTVSLIEANLNKLKFSNRGTNTLFDYTIYREMLRVLSPPFHTANEGVPITYSKKQLRLTESGPARRMKICGIAGSGKTTVLAKRAVNAHKRHEDQVLVLTYNLTLCSFIKDRISQVREDFSWGAFEIINYHKFMMIAMNNAGIDVSVPDDVEDIDAYFEEHYFSNLTLFSTFPAVQEYQTILIDEIQDYRPEWIKIIRDNFLAADGEMVLFGDEKQNIYGRPVDNERKSCLVEGFGRWEKLTQSFRYQQDSHILSLAQEFQRKFLSTLYEFDTDEAYQPSLNMLGINATEQYQENEFEHHVASCIISIAKKNDIHPNDISVLSSHEKLLQEIDYVLRTSALHRERTLTTFPSKEIGMHARLSKEGKKIGSSKKYGFNLNSGVMKLSTTHSFKGFESPTVFLLINKHDGPEMVYTGLTRAKENIIVFCDKESQFCDFFEKELVNLAEYLPTANPTDPVFSTANQAPIAAHQLTPAGETHGH